MTKLEHPGANLHLDPVLAADARVVKSLFEKFGGGGPGVKFGAICPPLACQKHGFAVLRRFQSCRLIRTCARCRCDISCCCWTVALVFNSLLLQVNGGKRYG